MNTKTFLSAPALRVVTGVIGVCFQAGIISSATDWPQYRGPAHDGSSTERILKEWPSRGPKLLWKKALPNGFGSFAVSQGKAYTSLKRVIEGEAKEVYVALNADTGAELWATAVGTSAREGIQGEGDGPRSTPAVDGDRVYVLNAQVALYCLDAANGQVVWKRDFIQEFGGRSPDFDGSASPLIVGDLVLVNGPARGTGEKLFGIDKRTGRTVWEGPRAIGTHSTPVATTLHGVHQVIFFTGGGILSVLPESGRELWRHSFTINIPVVISPVIAGDIIYHSAGYTAGARAVRVTKTGETFRATELWRKPGDLMNFLSTPIFYEGHLYGMFDHKRYGTGPLMCVELATGQEKWSEPGFGTGQLLLVDGHLLVQDDDGALVLVKPDPQRYIQVARYQGLASTSWNGPAISNGRIYARSIKEGICLDVSVKSLPPFLISSPRFQADGGFQFKLSSADGSVLSSDRLSRVEILTAPALPATIDQWLKIIDPVISADATVQVPPQGSALKQKFFIVREPQ